MSFFLLIYSARAQAFQQRHFTTYALMQHHHWQLLGRIGNLESGDEDGSSISDVILI